MVIKEVPAPRNCSKMQSPLLAWALSAVVVPIIQVLPSRKRQWLQRKSLQLASGDLLLYYRVIAGVPFWAIIVKRTSSGEARIIARSSSRSRCSSRLITAQSCQVMNYSLLKIKKMLWSKMRPDRPKLVSLSLNVLLENRRRWLHHPSMCSASRATGSC